jgi:2-methylisocitrate lyase-like PEP mutase family enzyme
VTLRQEQSAAAERFRDLHRPGSPVVLPNVWDVASARIVESAGFPALATTSAGVAYAAGYPDGERIPRDRMVEAVARICARVRVPVTADMEAGHGGSPEEVRRTALAVLDAGAVGLNIEDSKDDEAVLVDASLQAERVRAVREAGTERGVEIVINARTDVFFSPSMRDLDRVEEAARRAGAYRAAGADCIFVPGVTDPETIAALVKRLACPVNVLAVAGSLSVPELTRLGVARVSLGSGPMRGAMTYLRRLARETLSSGRYPDLEGIISHAEMQELMK